MSGPDRVLVVEGPGVLTLRPEPDPGPLPPGRFQVRTLYSGLSAGTDLSWVKGTHPGLRCRWDAELGLFEPPAAPRGYPIERFGYMQVGRVAAGEGRGAVTGDLVAMTYGHRTAYRADPLVDRAVPLPPDLDPVLGIYAAHMGPICANGLLHAAAELHGTDVRALSDGVAGRRVAVTGAGVVGLLTALFARHHGAQDTVLVDPTPVRRALAARFGLEAVDPDRVDPAVLLKTRWRHGPADRGADVVFQCRGQPAALHQALRMVRPQGAVIDLAFYPAGGDELRLGEEFHHNGLSIRCAQIGRVPRGTAHLWDRERLSAETLALLRHEGPALSEHLLTDVVPFDEAPAVLLALAERRRSTVQLVLAT